MTDPSSTSDHFRRAEWLAISLVAVIALLASRAFAIQEDEILILTLGLRTPAEVIRLFLNGVGQHVHPPLSDFILAAWLHLTGAADDILRLPNVIFYVVGVWWSARAAEQLSQRGTAALLVMVLAALWPFGAQAEWMFGWFSFAFMLVAGLTLAYARYHATPTIGRLTLLITGSVALVWTNYFGWALLGLLGLDWLWRMRNQDRHNRRVGHMATWVVVAMVSFLPLLSALHTAITSRVGGDSRGLISRIIYGVWNLYLSLGGESVAPWVLPWIIIGVLGAVVAFGVAWWHGKSTTRRLLTGYVVALGVLALIGQSGAKRLFFLTPWLLIGLGVALTEASRDARRLMAGGLATVAAIGWLGVAVPRGFASLRLLDPWREIAATADLWLLDGGTVVAFHPAIFYDLTLRQGDGRHYDPDVRRRNKDRAIDVSGTADVTVPKGRVLVIEATGFVERQGYLDAVIQRLKIHCTPRWTRGYLEDPQAEAKNRFGSQASHRAFEATSTAYDCSTAVAP